MCAQACIFVQNSVDPSWLPVFLVKASGSRRHNSTVCRVGVGLRPHSSKGSCVGLLGMRSGPNRKVAHCIAPMKSARVWCAFKPGGAVGCSVYTSSPAPHTQWISKKDCVPLWSNRFHQAGLCPGCVPSRVPSCVPSGVPCFITHHHSTWGCSALMKRPRTAQSPGLPCLIATGRLRLIGIYGCLCVI